ncbi:hypothetical protein [Haliangium sp.]|uniref:hypothetical protein n=1 Tax=Haliangium sp. TaxID=2663208 RepID=UPI003D0A7C6B
MTRSGIGTLNEKALHAALKRWYAAPGDCFEVPVDGYQVDIVRDDLLIEIQTASFSSIRRKLRTLTPTRRIRLVHPIASERWIVKQAAPGQRGAGTRRKSPKRGRIEDIFVELVSFPELLACPNFGLEVLLVREEDVRRFDRKRAWRRRGWVTEERRLLDVVARHRFDSPEDMASLLPDELPAPFLTSDLAAAIGRPRWVAQKMAYCLRNMGVIEATGKRGNALAYERVSAAR